ncbi:MAG: hypothetical protein JWN46_74 [Acidimicrobiales bacterium]|nr:hypothetical protein [Acidimicrobiales bacterium]
MTWRISFSFTATAYSQTLPFVFIFHHQPNRFPLPYRCRTCYNESVKVRLQVAEGAHDVHVADWILVPSAFVAVATPNGDAEDIPYEVEFQISYDGGTPTCDAFTVRRVEGGPAVTQSFITGVTLTRWVADMTRAVAYLGDPESEFIAGRLIEAPNHVQLEASEILRKRARRRSLTDDLLQQVSSTYREAAADGAPTRAVSEKYSVAHSTAARWIAEARKRGFLTHTTRGRIGKAEL